VLSQAMSLYAIEIKDTFANKMGGSIVTHSPPGTSTRASLR
jgi:hypothetical protein